MSRNELKQTKVKDYHENSINSIEIINSLLLTCCENEVKLNNQSTKLTQTLLQSDTSEIGIVKELDTNHTFATNSNILHLFDIQSCKQLNKYKFCKDTINAIDVNVDATLIACGDDTGDVKLLDTRLNPIEIKLKTTLKKHSNLCFCVKFGDNHSLYTGSYDCKVVNWDLRNLKSPSCFVSVTDIIEEATQQTVSNENDAFVSNMTPSFVHNIQFNPQSLLVGVENGLCLSLNPDDLKLKFSKQLQQFNSALTQIVHLNGDMWCCGGNDGLIRFFRLNDSQIDLVEEATIEHKFKINCMAFHENLLYVGDTTSDLTVYNDVEQLFNKNS